MKEYTMRGTYEAFILVRVKDGREFVCALNRQRNEKNMSRRSREEMHHYLQRQVIWN